MAGIKIRGGKSGGKVAAGAIANDAALQSDGFVSKSFNAADGVATAGYNLPFLTIIGTSVAGLGEKLPKFLGAPFKVVGNTLKAPEGYLKSHSVEDVVKGVARPSGLKTLKTAGNVSQVMGDFGRFVEKSITEGPLKPLGKLRDRQVESLQGRAVAARGKAKAEHDLARPAWDAAHDALGDAHLSGVRKVVMAAKKDFATLETNNDAMHLAARAQKLQEHQQAFNKAVVSAKSAIPKDNKSALEALKKAGESFEKASKHIGKAHGQLEAEAQHASKAVFRQNLEKGFKGLLGSVSKMSAEHAFTNTVYGVSQTATAYRTAKLFTSDNAVFKHMYTSVTGEKPPAFVLFRKLPDSLNEARWQAIKSAVPQAIANGVGMLIFRQMMKAGAGGKTMALGALVQVGASVVGGSLAEKNSELDAYKIVAQAQAMGQEIPAGAYIGFLAHASKKAGSMEMGNKRLQAVAQQYADEKTSIGAVLKELDNGGFQKRLAEVKLSAPAEAAPAAAIPQVDAQKAADDTPQLATAPTSQPVVGEFSAKVASENRSNARTITVPAATHMDAIKNEPQPAEAVAAR